MLEQGLLAPDLLSTIVNAVGELVSRVILAEAGLEEALRLEGIGALQGVDLGCQFAEHSLQNALFFTHGYYLFMTTTTWIYSS